MRPRKVAECEESLRRMRSEREWLKATAKWGKEAGFVPRQALADMEANREGYHPGVRAVLSEAPRRGWD